MDIERIEILCKLSGSKEVAKSAALTDATNIVDSRENPELSSHLPMPTHPPTTADGTTVGLLLLSHLLNLMQLPLLRRINLEPACVARILGNVALGLLAPSVERRAREAEKGD